MRNSNERGIAMITTLLVLMLISALLVGFTTMVMSDQRFRFIDHDRGAAFYAASGAVEKLTADLGNQYFKTVGLTNAQINTMTATASLPAITGITYAGAAPAPLPGSSLRTDTCIAAPPNGAPPAHLVTSGTPGYTITFCADNTTGNPTTIYPPNAPIKTGPYAGLIALQTPFQLDVTAKTSTGGEVHLARTIEAVAIPVFQFGMFSDVDLSFFAGPNFNFGGRVQTNGNLFLAEGDNNTLMLSDRVTALGQVVRKRLQNNVTIATNNSSGVVSIAKAANIACVPIAACRTLGVGEGSVVDGIVPAPNPAVYPASPFNEPTWTTTSLSAYNSWLRNGKTGAKKLVLPLTAVGGSNPDLIRRPAVSEDTANAILYNERLYTKASVRILLSDTAADITGLPGATAGAPVLLEGDWNKAFVAGVGGAPAGYTTTVNNGVGTIANNGLGRPPIALSPGARKATVTASGGTAPTATITFSAADAALFKPTFALCAGAPCAVVPATPITCSVQTLTQLQNCTNVPNVANGSFLTAISPAGGLSGNTLQINAATGGGGTGPISAASMAQFNNLPFWDPTTAPPTLIECRGTYTATQLTGCSRMPSVGAILVTGAMSDAGISTIGGWIKIDRQNVDFSWTDVTAEVLNYGIGDVNSLANGDPDAPCYAGLNNPSPNAIVRLQRLRGNSLGALGCDYITDKTGALDPTNWWPLTLFDAREGQVRDPAVNPFTVSLGGVMYYVNIDVGNLTKWFKHNTAPFNLAASTGNLARTDGTGYTVYFSDRRANRDATLKETAEFGWEDFVNPASATGQPNGVLDAGEDVNGNGILDVYGNTPHYTPTPFTTPAVGVPPCAIPQACSGVGGVYTSASTGGYVLGTAALGAVLNAAPLVTITPMVAKVNRAVLFRRALVLSNAKDFGGAGVKTVAGVSVAADRLTGLTVVSENPVYVRGDFNADSPVGTGFTGVNAATSVIADAVTLLSNNWTDANSFGTIGPPATSPYDVSATGPRLRTPQSWYRLAIIGGKGPAFIQPTVGGVAADFGTDGGAHNFLRLLESSANGTDTVNYMGSIATFFYNRQAVGTYKCCNNVYSPPVRAYSFDILFLNPATLPPNTPMFRDLNAVGFSQELRPGK